MRSRPQHDARTVQIFASRHSQSGVNLHQSLAGAKSCRSSEQGLALFIADRSFHIHLAERWLMTT
jgi:hypothetical protein